MSELGNITKAWLIPEGVNVDTFKQSDLVNYECIDCTEIGKHMPVEFENETKLIFKDLDNE